MDDVIGDVRDEEAQLRARFGVPDSVAVGVNDLGWMRVLADGDVEKQLAREGSFRITAKRLKALSRREPRLMAKHDFSSAQPWILAQRGLAVLPVSRSEYAVGPFPVFEDFPAGDSPGVGPPDAHGAAVRYRPFPAHLRSLDYSTISSEATALNAAFAAGIVEDFLGCGPLTPTVSGRMSTLSFSARCGEAEITVSNAQMEIDGGYESAELLCLVEAKNHLSRDFNIRQVYFPYRRFADALNKPVVPVYVVYSDGLFHLYRYGFRDRADMSSIELVDAAVYALTDEVLSLDSVRAILAATPAEPEPAGIPFPQANSFARIINLGERLLDAPLTKEDIYTSFDFDRRQADYYATALEYIGLAEFADGELHLSAAGEQIMAAGSRAARHTGIIGLLARRSVLHDALGLMVREERCPTADELAGFMAAAGLGLSESTMRRRAHSTVAWLRWVWQACAQPPLTLL